MVDNEATDEGYWGLAYGLPRAETLLAEMADQS